MRHVKIAVTVVSVLALLMGVLWLLQGVNILRGSPMSGDIQWSYRGGGLIVIALALLSWSARVAGAWQAIFMTLAILMVLMGSVWVLQGLSILPGSFMSGGIRWSYRGGVLALIGLALIWTTRRARRAAN